MKNLDKLFLGYKEFRNKYAVGDSSVMKSLSMHGQQPKIMFVACCDSRVDPALILQCDPGDLFVVRNVANIVPPYEKDNFHHGTSAALEFAVLFLKVEHIIILGHTECGGIQALLNSDILNKSNDFIGSWVSIVDSEERKTTKTPNEYAQIAIHKSYENCLTFPWIRESIDAGLLSIHKWFFDIEKGMILHYDETQKKYTYLQVDKKDLL